MTGRGRPAVFLDRDGVLNGATRVAGLPHPPDQKQPLAVLPDVADACAALRAAGLLLVLVSNQPDVARGTVRREDIDARNRELQTALRLDAVLVCPHDDGDNCDCRKPRPGMILEAARQLDIDLARSVMVGDRWVDVEAGRAAGCRTVFIDHDYRERRPEVQDRTVRALRDAVPYILAVSGNGAAPASAATMPDLLSLRVHIYADGADRDGIVALSKNPIIRGFTTNPTLMRAAGVMDYERFARDVLTAVPDLPISFEVFADDFEEMKRQALRIASWGDQIYVKIPVTDTSGRPSTGVVHALRERGVKLNVTALFTPDQVDWVTNALAGGPSSFISVFAGRIADSGRDPIPIMRECLEIMAPHPQLRLIWASPREVLNIIQANDIGCHVITVTHDLLKKLTNIGKGLEQFSLETVQMFHSDAAKAGYSL